MWLLVTGGAARSQTDLAPLFDPATPAEINTVQADWATRSHNGTEFTINTTATYAGFTLSRVSFMYDGLKQYGFLRYPRDYDPAGDFPVMVIHHGGETGIYYTWVTGFDADWPGTCVADSFFVLAPSYRGEACNGSSLLGIKVSEGSPSLWDRDCDDGMAMVRAFLDVTPQADPGRVFSLGRSRGSIVAYHQAVRDPLVQRSVILFAASDYRHDTILEDCQIEADGGPVATNTLSRKVMAHMVWPWLDGEQTLGEVRERLCAWSIIHHLSGDLSMQLHHGELDMDIPIQHSEWTETAMLAQGAGAPDFELFRYPLASHGTSGMLELGQRVEAYVCGFPGRVSAADTPSLAPELRAWPNPFQGRVDLRLSGDAALKAGAEPQEIEILDLRGRVVRTLALTAGLARWDSRDAAGRTVGAGVYLARTKNPGQSAGAFLPPEGYLKLVVLH